MKLSLFIKIAAVLDDVARMAARANRTVAPAAARRIANLESIAGNSAKGGGVRNDLVRELRATRGAIRSGTPRPANMPGLPQAGARPALAAAKPQATALDPVMVNRPAQSLNPSDSASFVGRGTPGHFRRNAGRYALGAGATAVTGGLAAMGFSPGPAPVQIGGGAQPQPQGSAPATQPESMQMGPTVTSAPAAEMPSSAGLLLPRSGTPTAGGDFSNRPENQQPTLQQPAQYSAAGLLNRMPPKPPAIPQQPATTPIQQAQQAVMKGPDDDFLARTMGSYNPASRRDQAKASRIRQLWAQSGGQLTPDQVYADQGYANIDRNRAW